MNSSARIAAQLRIIDLIEEYSNNGMYE